MKPPKPRNPAALALRAPTFSKKIVRSRKAYTRDGRTTVNPHDDNTPALRAPPGLRAARGTPRVSAALRGDG